MKSDFGNTHSITLVVDSLAVMSVFERLGLDMSAEANDTNHKSQPERRIAA